MNADPLVPFLVRFSVALHKHATYPAGHPTLIAADEALLAATDALFATRAELRLGVARRALLLDGAPLDEAGPVAEELAERLQRREVGGLVLRRGIGAEELGAALDALSADPRRVRARMHGDGEPLPSSPCLEIVPPAYRRLALADGEGGAPDGETDASQRLWAALAAEAGSGEAAPAADALAARIGEAVREPARARAIGDLLVRLGTLARSAPAAEREALEERLRALVAGLPPESVGWLFGADEPVARRAQLADAMEALPSDAVVELLQAASSATRQEISHSMLRLLWKLAGQAREGGAAAGAGDAELRETARAMLDDWTLDDPNPFEHTRLLESLSRLDGAGGVAAPGAEGRRVVAMALETDATGDHLAEALDRMLEEGELGALLDLLAEGPEAPAARAQVRAHLASPGVVRAALLEEPVDAAEAGRLLDHLGADAAAGLLDALAISESQDTRRLVFERLAALGEAVADALVARLPAVPWYVQRNLLALLARLKRLPAGLDVTPYAAHAEPTVRIQGLYVLSRQPGQREEAIRLAIGDADPRIVKLGIDLAVASGLPRAAVTRLMLTLNGEAAPPELKARGIRLLAQAPAPATRDWLLARVLLPRTLLRGPRLAPKGPEVLAALGVLAARWADHPQSARALRMAAESGDPELAAAAAGTP